MVLRCRLGLNHNKSEQNGCISRGKKIKSTVATRSLKLSALMQFVPLLLIHTLYYSTQPRNSSPIPRLQISSWNHAVNWIQILIWIKNKPAERFTLLKRTEPKRSCQQTQVVQCTTAQRLAKEHLHQHHLCVLCQTRVPEKHETTTTDVSGNSAPCTVGPVRTAKGHSKVYRHNTAEKTLQLENTKHSLTFCSYLPSQNQNCQDKNKGNNVTFFTEHWEWV